MTIDTTVVNGRFIHAGDPSVDAISVQNGVILAHPELEDVWRTVDAAGYFVLPGVVQVGQITASLAPIIARHGVTTIVGNVQSTGRVSGGFDFVRCQNLDDIQDVETLHDARQSGVHVFETARPRPELAEALAGTVLRLRGEAAEAMDWCEPNTIVLVADDPRDLPMTKLAVEIPASALTSDYNDPLWEIVLDESRSVIITAGETPEYPVLHMLFDEGHRKRGMTPERIADVTARTPAETFGLSQSKGRLLPGYHGDLVVFDHETQDPYRDEPYPGRVIFSLRRGDIFFYNGQLHADSEDGQDLSNQ